MGIFTPTISRGFDGAWSLDSRDVGGVSIATDYHAPNHSALWCNRLLAVCKRYKIRTHILAGDGLDMSAFSNWGADPEQSWTAEMDAASEWLWVLYHSFDRIYWLRGNHEDRLARTTNWQLQASQFIDAVLNHRARVLGVRLQFEPERLQLSNYPYCTIDGQWLIVHPKSYSRIPGRVANQIAMIRRRHVVAAHSHRANWGWADDGEHITIDTGGMFDEEHIGYRAMAVTTHPAWQHGFVLYRDGVAALMSDAPYTNWEQYGL